MKDLKFGYTNKNDKRITEEYNVIYDFTDRVESGEIDSSTLEGRDVDAIFFENKRNTKSFQTVKELYEHCVEIMK